MSVWFIITVLLYPLTTFASFAPTLLLPWGHWDLSRFSALASGLIVFLILWLYALPRDLQWSIGSIGWESRFVLPLTAYLAGLVVASVLLSWTKKPAH